MSIPLATAKMTSLTAVAVSLVLSGCVIGNAFRRKEQFFPAVVYICKSNPSMAIMYMQALITVYLLGKLIGKIFFGTLRPAESERLIEKSWYAITETCLAFTIFKDDLSPKFVALFTLLLFLKCFHWLAEDRVDYMERTPVISVLFHIRIWSLLTVLTIADVYFVHDAYITTITKGPSVQLVFGFEYALLITLAMTACTKYVLHGFDVHSDTFWESKAVLLLYLEFFIGLCKAVMYIAFLIIMVKTYTVPLFAFRPMYHTLRNFKKVFQDLVLSRKAIHNMNTLYPDATAQDLQTIENVCIICREDMSAAAAKKLPCNHIFHTSCLRSWFQRHQTCPTCRLDILRPTPITLPSTTVSGPPPTSVPPTVGASTPSSSVSSSNNADANGQGLPGHNQAGNISNFFNNQSPLPYQFRQYAYQQQRTSVDGNNSNTNENLNNSDSQQNNMSESWAEYLNIPGPSFFNVQQSSSSNINFDNRTPFPGNIPFVGEFLFDFQTTGVAIQHPELPADLDTLSHEELYQMEQNTRAACIARLKYVTDIKTMLDAAMVMMNHYSSACLVAGLDSTNSTDSTNESNTKHLDDYEQFESRPSSNSSSETDSSDIRYLLKLFLKKYFRLKTAIY
ncbi:Hypothetical protein CINCED_3A018772 [Cinara cedri]|uniref:RING-type E3 ubiquitin transferase n=1 Tax=Cinara cedri TaxID=506608 RepID=A0A5E4MGA4_9HEMI|nr:Hypothetical protein CINCED_3A018772 [Cinara cedri]